MVAFTSNPKTKIAFVAWRRLSRRTTLLCKALDVELWYFPDRLPYLRAAYRTFNSVRKNRPKILLIQLPQGPLLLQALLLRIFFGCKIVADVHSGFLMEWEWKSYLLNAPFRRLLRHADQVLIHNSAMKELLSNGTKDKTLVVYDPWPLIEVIPSKGNDGDYLVFPASYHPDEPLEEVLACIQKNFPEIRLYVTGDWRRRPSVKKYESKNVIFTGFLSPEDYEDLIAGAKAIISGTKEEYTALMSAWEAVAHGKPLILSDSKALRETLEDYPSYYDYNDPRSIKEAIERIGDIQPYSSAREALLRKTMASLDVLKSELARW
jgi:glycosyltransferase involved in cell wall biosynthesis